MLRFILLELQKPLREWSQGVSLRGTRPSYHQTIEAKAHLKHDPAPRKLGYQIEPQNAFQLERRDFRAWAPDFVCALNT